MRLQEAVDRFAPTRLVQVKVSNYVLESIRLVTQPELRNTKGYLTLSHCWGGANIIQLTKATLGLFHTSIPTTGLPKNFSDALKIVVWLGFEYIWIDSLCIIQDSDLDWQRESQQMGRIYRHSQMTIAAVKSRDSHGGLFSKRDALSLVPCRITGGHQDEFAHVEYLSFARIT